MTLKLMWKRVSCGHWSIEDGIVLLCDQFSGCAVGLVYRRSGSKDGVRQKAREISSVEGNHQFFGCFLLDEAARQLRQRGAHSLLLSELFG